VHCNEKPVGQSNEGDKGRRDLSDGGEIAKEI